MRPLHELPDRLARAVRKNTHDVVAGLGTFSPSPRLNSHPATPLRAEIPYPTALRSLPAQASELTVAIELIEIETSIREQHLSPAPSISAVIDKLSDRVSIDGRGNRP